MYLKTLLLFCLLSFFQNSPAQNISISSSLENKVFDVSEPLQLWIDFLNTKDDAAGAKYWNSAELKRFGSDAYFLIEQEFDFGTDNYLELLGSVEVKVLRVKQDGKYYKITSTLEFPRKGQGNDVMYVFHVFAGKEQGKWKLFNALTVHSHMHLATKTVGFIRYHFPKNHVFNDRLARQQKDVLTTLSCDFQIPLDTIDYYFAETQAEVLEMKGIDMLFGDNGKEIPSGKADPENRIVYSSGCGEYYPHELIHVLLNPHFPDCHWWFNEGVATYFGLSRGKALDWHLKKVAQHVKAHPEINLNNMLELSSLDQFTDYRYALGGLLIEMAFRKGGYPLIQELMRAGSSDEDFYAAIEKYLGIKRADLNAVIRKDLMSRK